MTRTLGIVGVGLIGGSVGLAASNSGWDVFGVDRLEVLEEAVQSGAIHRASTVKEVRGADLVVLAAPISRVTALIENLTPTNTLVTDVASAKGAIVTAAEDRMLRFVGGHPMAGSQLSGVATHAPTSSREPATSSPRQTAQPPRTTARSPGSSGSLAPSQPPSTPRHTTFSWRPSRTCRTSWPPPS